MEDMKKMGTKLSVIICMFALTFCACSKDPVEKAYQGCLKQMETQFNTTQGKDSKDPMAGAIEGMAQGMGKAICDGIKDACKQDREGQICQAAISQYR